MRAKLFFQKDFLQFEVLARELPKVFSKNDSVAVKLHMGERGNRYYLKPELVKKLIKAMKDCGLKPFLFDSPVMYGGARDTPEKYLENAKRHGFLEIEIGCPVVISDDFVEVKTQHLTAQVCKPLSEADGMLVLSHVKGHACSGFGGAIKNLGMGGVTKKTKADIHAGSSPICFGECTGCGTCQRYCPAGAITVKEKAFFNLDSCWGCNLCVTYCPQKALRVKVASFDRLLSEGAYAVLKAVKKTYFVNVMKDLTQFCDCVGGGSNEIVGPDVGVLFGNDIAAIEKASMDLINKKVGYDLFLKVNHKSPIEHIKEAEKLGMGSLDYEIRE